jgi:hypothetical protein
MADRKDDMHVKELMGPLIIFVTIHIELNSDMDLTFPSMLISIIIGYYLYNKRLRKPD